MQGITDKHKATHEAMMRLTAEMPMIQNQANLQMYFAGTFRDDKDLIVMRMLKNFSVPKLHNSSYDYTQIVITGGVSYESLSDSGACYPVPQIPSCSMDFVPVLERDFKYVNDLSSVSFELHCGGGKKFTVFDFNRLAACQPDTWIVIITSNKRLPRFFARDDNGFFETHKPFPRDWWKDYKPRPAEGICLIGDDNSKE